MKSVWLMVRRWMKGTSNRTFVFWPITLWALESLIAGGWPSLQLWALPLLVWGYGQYKLVGVLRNQRGGGGPGMSNPPLRLLTTGPYGYVRNPMYLGHLIFFLGLAFLFASGTAWMVFLIHLFWFDSRARHDEEHLLQLFGSPYLEYCARVKRWLPGVY